MSDAMEEREESSSFSLEQFDGHDPSNLCHGGARV